MRFFRRKPKIDVKVVELTIASIARQLLHDGVMGDPVELARLMELPPLSEDVLEAEEEASHERLHNVDFFVPLLEAHAMAAGKICMASYKLNNPEENWDLRAEEEMEALFRVVSFSSSLTALSFLLDLGVITAEGDLI